MVHLRYAKPKGTTFYCSVHVKLRNSEEPNIFCANSFFEDTFQFKFNPV